MYTFREAGHSLYSLCHFGFSPFSFNSVCILVNARNISASVLDFLGYPKMVFASYAYIIMTYLFLLLEVTGKQPVWSENVFPVVAMDVITN